MPDRINATHPACTTCAAKIASSEGFVCQPWRLGQSNNNSRFVIGRKHSSGTTLRPSLCPHPENKVMITPTAGIVLRKLLNK